MKDRIIRGTAAKGQVRFLGVDCLEVVQEAQTRHHLSITASVALGRAIAGALMMGATQKSKQEILTLKFNTNGAVKTMIVTSKSDGSVKAYIDNPEAELPLAQGRIDVGGLLGSGTLTVIRDLQAKAPYIGTIELQNSEIATDLSYYYSQSEQIPTAVGLGVLVEQEGTIRQAGGFIIQLMPEADGGVIDLLEKNLSHLPNLTDLLDMGYNIEKIIQEMILADLQPQLMSSTSAQYKCDCSREKFFEGIKLLDKHELEEELTRGEGINVQCHFCNTVYNFSAEDIKKALEDK